MSSGSNRPSHSRSTSEDNVAQPGLFYILQEVTKLTSSTHSSPQSFVPPSSSSPFSSFGRFTRAGAPSHLNCEEHTKALSLINMECEMLLQPKDGPDQSPAPPPECSPISSPSSPQPAGIGEGDSEGLTGGEGNLEKSDGSPGAGPQPCVDQCSSDKTDGTTVLEQSGREEKEMVAEGKIPEEPEPKEEKVVMVMEEEGCVHPTQDVPSIPPPTKTSEPSDDDLTIHTQLACVLPKTEPTLDFNGNILELHSSTKASPTHPGLSSSWSPTNEDQTSTLDPEAAPLQGSSAWRTKTPRKQAHPSRSADGQDPNFQGVTFRMDTVVDDSREQCHLLVTCKYSKELLRSAKRPRSRPRASPSSSSSDEEAELATSVPKAKVCASCCTRKTPMWRDAEDGTPLCNACGIRYKKYRVRCVNCWHIPRKEGNSKSSCLKCGNFVRPSAVPRKHSA